MRLLAFLLLATAAFAGEATPADQITVPPGFKVELLRSAGAQEGSWIALAVDGQGRLYISPQGAIPYSGFKKDSAWGGLWRATVSIENQKSKIENWEKVPVPVGDAMGMLWAFDSLYVSGEGPEGRGIYRLKDTDGDDTLDSAAMWKKIPGGHGEHGAHALVLGPDGKSIYIAHGNSTPLIDGIAPDSPYKNYGEDILVPRVMDPVATFFDKIKSPYGYILRTDEHGTRWELFAGGLRNQYDLDFNADGELFTYDSDMEWDVGLPWYRPSRVLHLVPGGEYGFREGNQKWPTYYEDSLPAVVDIGLGCPTGVKFGTRAAFPEKYRRAFYIMDWTFGRLLAVHMKAEGASYTAKNPLKSTVHPTGPEPSAHRADTTAGGSVASALRADSAGGDVEVFLSGKGLPLTDLEVGADGAMYFTVGGRGTQGGLYRVSWNEPAEQPRKAEQKIGPGAIDAQLFGTDEQKATAREHYKDEWPERYAANARAGRQMMEEMKSIPELVTALSSDSWFNNLDRFSRNAARLHLERNPELFPTHLTADATTNPEKIAPRAALTALLALARVGGPETQADLLQALTRFPMDSLDDSMKLLKLRVLKLTFIRQGRPAPELVAMGTAKLLAQFPARGPRAADLNRELSELLVWLTNPALGTVNRTVATGSDSQPTETLGRGAQPASPSTQPPSRAEQPPSLDVTMNADPSRSATETVERTLKLLEDPATAPDSQIWYACMLREAAGWAPGQRERYFRWFARARGYHGGNSFAKFIERIKEQALANVPADARGPLAELAAQAPPSPAPAAAGPARAFQKAWTLADLEADLPRVARGRNFARGKEIYASTQCAACHLFHGGAGNVGPDLSAVAQRFQRRDILEAILDPSKAVSEQYASWLFTMKSGELIAGQVALESNYHFDVIVDPLTGARRQVGKTALKSKEPNPASLMPPGLLNVLTRDEILDLLAYLESGGNAAAGNFK